MRESNTNSNRKGITDALARMDGSTDGYIYNPMPLAFSRPVYYKELDILSLINIEVMIKMTVSRICGQRPIIIIIEEDSLQKQGGSLYTPHGISSY